MNLNLRGKVAIVTGVSSIKVRMGLGAAISEVLAQEGVNVVANYIVDGEDVLEFAENLNKKYGVQCTAMYGDVSKPGDIDVIIDKTLKIYGKMDILINNAGILPVTNVTDMADEEWERVIKINLSGAFFFSKRFANYLIRKEKPGRILNITSKSGFSVTSPGRSHYAVSKGGLVTLTKALAREFTQYRIIVNGIAPGILRTPLNNKLLENHEAERNYIKRVPMGRMTDPMEIAYMAAFMVSDKAETTPGTVVDATGGMLI